MLMKIPHASHFNKGIGKIGGLIQVNGVKYTKNGNNMEIHPEKIVGWFRLKAVWNIIAYLEVDGKFIAFSLLNGRVLVAFPFRNESDKLSSVYIEYDDLYVMRKRYGISYDETRMSYLQDSGGSD